MPQRVLVWQALPWMRPHHELYRSNPRRFEGRMECESVWGFGLPDFYPVGVGLPVRIRKREAIQHRFKDSSMADGLIRSSLYCFWNLPSGLDAGAEWPR